MLAHGLLGEAAGLLVAEDARVAESGDVDGQPVDVRRDDARPRVQPVAAVEARDGHAAVRLGEEARSAPGRGRRCGPASMSSRPPS